MSEVERYSARREGSRPGAQNSERALLSFTLITDDSAESAAVKSSIDELRPSYDHVHEPGIREDRPAVFLPEGPGRRLYYGFAVITGVFIPRLISHLNGHLK